MSIRLVDPNREEGQALLEYAMILGMVAVICAGVLGALGTSITGLLSSVANAF